MESNQKTAQKSFGKGQGKDRKLILQHIVKQVETGIGLNYSELKKQYSEEKLFYLALKHITITKKALCKALDINVDNACWYKRRLEKNGHLVQSIDKVICPLTKHAANLISTNPKEFERLLKSNTNQLNLFE